MTDTNTLQNSTSLLPVALAATDAILGKVRDAREKIVTLNVDIGVAFGKAIAAAHIEPLAFVPFCLAYEEPLLVHCKAALGYLSGNALQVMLRSANLVAAGHKVPTRAAVIKANGKEKPLSDTAYMNLLREAQRKAGLTVIKPGCGGDNRSADAIATAAAKAATEAAAKASTAAATAAAAGKPAPVIPAPQVVGKPAAPAAPPVPAAIDTAKAREDAAAAIMGSAKHGDLLLQAVKTRKAALIKWLSEKPKA